MLLIKSFISWKISIIFSAIRWIPWAAQVTWIRLEWNGFKLLAALTIYGTSLDNINKTFSSLPPSGHNIYLRQSFTNFTMVLLFVFSRTLNAKRYNFDGESTFNFLTIKFAIYLPRESVVSLIQKYMNELPIFSRFFF